MNARVAACTAILVAATAAACSSGEPAPRVTVTVTKTVTATPSAEAADPSDGVLKMGAKKAINDDANNVHTVIQAVNYQQPYKGPQPQKPEDFQGGDVWATASIKVCNIKGTEVSVSQMPWSLAYADGTTIPVTGGTGGDMPKPEYPMDKILKPGRCVAGLIAFPVPSKKKPERLVYEPDGTEPTEWAIG